MSASAHHDPVFGPVTIFNLTACTPQIRQTYKLLFMLIPRWSMMLDHLDKAEIFQTIHMTYALYFKFIFFSGMFYVVTILLCPQTLALKVNCGQFQNSLWSLWTFL